MDDFIINGGSGSGSSRRKLPEQEKKKEEKETVSIKIIVTVLIAAMIFVIMMASVFIPVVMSSFDDHYELQYVEKDYSFDNPNPDAYYLTAGSSIPNRTETLSFTSSLDFYNNFIFNIQNGEYVTEGVCFVINPLDWTPGAKAPSPDSYAMKVSVITYNYVDGNMVRNVTTSDWIDEFTSVSVIYSYIAGVQEVQVKFNGIQFYAGYGSLWVKNGQDYGYGERLYQVQQYGKEQNVHCIANTDTLLCIPTYKLEDYPTQYAAEYDIIYSEYILPNGWKYGADKLYELKDNKVRANHYRIETTATDYKAVTITALHSEMALVPWEGPESVKNLILVIPTILIVMFIAYLCRNFMSFGGRGGKGGQE